MLGISLDTWVRVAAIVAAGITIIASDRADAKKREKEVEEDWRKYRAEVREGERKHQAALRKILATRLAEDD